MPLDDADKTVIAGLIKSSLTDLVGELDKKFVTGDAAQKMVTQGLTKGLADAGLDKVGDTLSGITATLEKLGKDGGHGGDGDKNKDKDKDKTDPAVARLQSELDELKTKNQAAEEARQAAEERSRNSTLDNQIRAALTQVGIPTERHELVIPVLRAQAATDGKPVLRFGDDGKPVYVAQRKGYTDSLSVADGIKEWGATDMAKVYLPPAGQGGTGGGAGGGNPNRSSTAPRDDQGNTDWGAIGSMVKLNPSASAEA